MIKTILTLLVLLFVMSCSSPQETQTSQETSAYKVPVYGWLGGPGDATDQQLRENFTDLKNKGIDGLMYNGATILKLTGALGKLPKKWTWHFIPGYLRWYKVAMTN